MAKRNFGAVAVDLGASSGRFAAGWLEEGRIRFEVVEQKAHNPVEHKGRLEWDLDSLTGIARRGADYASEHFDSATIGIDSWGVDHGFIDANGKLMGNPVCYRDLSHAKAFEQLSPCRAELYRLTGIQHQPFNTICQLTARRLEDPDLPNSARFMILPDLIGYLLAGEVHHELTQASTTQLLGLDSQWSERAYEIAGWPVPEDQPVKPAILGGIVSPGVRLSHVGSHDTASALVGFGGQADDLMYVNVGTWSLAMFIRDEPIATPEAERANFTNERMADGRVRFLKNIPGFYILNRLHEELKVRAPMADWIRAMDDSGEAIDLFDPVFFNPHSMVEACAKLLGRMPVSREEWAGIGVNSLAKAVATQPAEAAALGINPIRSIRIGGGGSQSEVLCQAIANAAGVPVYAGPVEATVLGNLGVQFLAFGAIGSFAELADVIERSYRIQEYLPQ